MRCPHSVAGCQQRTDLTRASNQRAVRLAAALIAAGCGGDMKGFGPDGKPPEQSPGTACVDHCKARETRGCAGLSLSCDAACFASCEEAEAEGSRTEAAGKVEDCKWSTEAVELGCKPVREDINELCSSLLGSGSVLARRAVPKSVLPAGPC